MMPLLAVGPIVCAIPLLFMLAVLFYLLTEAMRNQDQRPAKPPDPDGMPENWPANWPRPKREKLSDELGPDPALDEKS